MACLFSQDVSDVIIDLVRSKFTDGVVQAVFAFAIDFAYLGTILLEYAPNLK